MPCLKPLLLCTFCSPIHHFAALAESSAGDEIVYLAERLPNHSFFGLDLSEGMVDVAKEAVAAAGIR